ncbi:MAG: tetratricopeptide repeat protein [Phormidesmis sp.]
MGLDDLSPQNHRELRKLVVSIQANAQALGLLLAVCDDRNLQAELIGEYEAELEKQGVKPFRIRLDLKRPSLKAALTELVAKEPDLQKGEPAVVTVLNAGDLLSVQLTDEKSEQERFFFSLQWTREALLRFEFPVVIWLSDAVATRLGQRAPDFWSWRNGVFEFEAAPQSPPELPLRPVFSPQPMREMDHTSRSSRLSISDLQDQISGLKETSPESSLLITLYNSLGKAYAQEYSYDEALVQYKKALALAKGKDNLAGQAKSLRNLGDSLDYSRRSQQAISFYEQSIEIFREISDRQGEATALNNLGNACNNLGRYQQAIKFLHQSIGIVREIGDRQGEANSLCNLGISYKALGQYQRAIEFYQQSIENFHEIGDRQGEANSLGSLGQAYHALGQYQRAIEFLQHQMELAREIEDCRGEASSLCSLGNVYHDLGRYQRAIEFHQQSLELAREIGDRQGEAGSLCNLGISYDALGQYQRAIEFHQQSLELARETSDRQSEANVLGNLGSANRQLGHYEQAINFFQQQIEIAREIGDRRGEANACFNRSMALARTDRKWEAQQSYEAARTLFKDLKLPKMVEECDAAIRDLGQQTVAIPMQAPTIGKAAPPVPDWLERSRPVRDVDSPRPRHQKQVPWMMWFLVGLGLVLLVWWLL